MKIQVNASKNDLQFTDIFNLEEIQSLQDLFSDAHGVASVIVQPDGKPITKPSEFCRFCDIIRKTEKGRQNCYKSDSLIGAHDTSGPIVKTCFSGGLWDAGASITVNGEHIASWLIGQVRNESVDERRMLQYADEIGVDKIELTWALKEVPVMSVHQFNKVAKMLFAFANSLSDRAFQNLQLKRSISERDKATVLLKESEERFQLLFNDAPLGYQSLDSNGCFIEVNQQWLNLLGFSRHEVIGKWFGDFLSPSYREGFIERFPIFKAQGRIHSEFEMVHKNGQTQFIAFEGKVGYDAEGDFKQTHCILQDISASKQAQDNLLKSEANLKKQNELLNSLLKNIPIGVFMVEAPTGKPLLANDTAYRLLGRGILPDVTKDNLSEVYKAHKTGSTEAYPPDEMPIVLGMQGEMTHIDDMVVDLPDGTETLLEIFGSPVADDRGQIWASLVSFFDITKRKQAEEVLRKSENMLQTVLDHFPGVVFWKDSDSNYLGCNQAFATGAGLTCPSDIIGKTDNDLPWALTEADNYRADDFQVMHSGIAKLHIVEMQHQTGGHVIWLDTSKIPLRDSNGQVIGVIGVSNDISDLKQTQEQILAKNKELENYLYIASHDLRSPLVNIQGFSQRLKKQADTIKGTLEGCDIDPEIKSGLDKLTIEGIPKTLNFILSNVAKMDTLINGLLQISRTGRMPMKIRKIDMNKLLNTIITAYNFQITELSAKVTISDLGDCFRDENLVNQLFSNIIGNAIKYRDKNRQLVIEISSRSYFNKTIYSIKDTGIGIASKYLDKIWDVFYRIDPNLNTEGEGIGLSLVKRITDKHKGNIRVESEEGKGSTFYVELRKNEFTE